jgi:F-type H+-transporting ATPase subunit delta
MRDEQKGIVEAHARSAMPMLEKDREKLAQALEDLTGQKVRLHVTEESDLVGGIVIRIGDLVYDASVRRQLERLRERMEAGSYLLN